MRKSVAVSVLILLLPAMLFFGCDKKTPPSFEPQREGSRTFTLKSKSFSCAGTVDVVGCGLCTVSFTAPENLTYLTIGENGETLTVTVGEHTDTLDLAMLPDHSVLKLLLQALETFLYHNLPFEKGETDTVTATAEVLGYTVTAVYTGDGALRKLTCGALDLAVTFA